METTWTIIFDLHNRVEKMIETYKEREEAIAVDTVDEAPKEPKRRGRQPSNVVVTFPTDKEFSIKEIAESNNVTPSDVYAYMKKHNVSLEYVREERRAKSGPPTKIYKLKNQ